MARQRGFTLIELMIVVAIIAILAAIAISQYQDYVAKAQVSEAFSLADGLKTKVSEVYTQTASCPANGAPGTGIPTATSIVGKYVAQTVTAGTPSTDGGCTLEMTFKTTGSVAPPLTSKTIVFKLVGVDSGSSHWNCSSAIPAKFLPKTCQN
jgi:type IV pilus assembly protein PilA